MNKKSFVFLMVSFVASICIFSGCTNVRKYSGNDKGHLTGTITIVGSTAMQPVVEKAAEKFMDKNQDLTINVQGGGSGTGLTQVLGKGADIGDSDVYADEKIKDKQKTSELVDHMAVVQGFAAIVNKDVNIDNLTKEQITEIFRGDITNWKDVGGQDLKIVVINRPSSSGTRITFIKKALSGVNVIKGNTLNEDSNGALLRTLENTPGAISYTGLAYLNDKVKPLKINGIEPTVENILAGKYNIWSFGHMYTKGQAVGAVKAFLEYMDSEEVAQMARQMRYIAGKDAKQMINK